MGTGFVSNIHSRIMRSCLVLIMDPSGQIERVIVYDQKDPLLILNKILRDNSSEST